MEKKIGEKIEFSRSKEKIQVSIGAKLEGWKEGLLMAWVIGWTLCGLYFISYFPEAVSKEEKMVIGVVLCFWVYFEFKIGRALFWSLWGKEQIDLDAGEFSLKNAIKGRGKKRVYPLENVQTVENREINPRSFSFQMEDSFWVIGGGKLQLDVGSKIETFGIKLKEQDAKLLADLLNKGIKDFKKKS